MKKALIILNHNPTENQLNQLKEIFNVNEILYLPSKLKNFISNVPPDKPIPEEFLKNITDFIIKNLQKDDIIWIQTEYGITFYIVDFAFKVGFIPIYSTTERIYNEKKLDNEKVERKYLFKHVSFRKYFKYNKR